MGGSGTFNSIVDRPDRICFDSVYYVFFPFNSIVDRRIESLRIRLC